MGFLRFSRACRMLFHSTRRLRELVIEPAPTPPIAAAVPLWAAIRSWVLWTTVTGSAIVLYASRDLSHGCDIPAVAGPSASSGDLRLADPSDLEAVTTDHGDVLPFRISFPSEVFAPSDGAL